jgi:hypothetical protein
MQFGHDALATRGGLLAFGDQMDFDYFSIEAILAENQVCLCRFPITLPF